MSVTNSQTIRQIFGMNKTDGDVGIEIEAEAQDGPSFPVGGLPDEWKAEPDGSLRGISIEYVLRKPIKIDKVAPTLQVLQDLIKKTGTRIHYSFRAGVHVHVNVQEMTPQQLLIYAAIYYSVENVLTEWCGEDRIGNHFCLRACDADAVLAMAGEMIAAGAYGNLGDNNMRYAALNFNAVPKYGSLEFRALSTEPDFKRIITWATMLYNLREKSKEFDSIQTLLEHFSMSTPEDWMKEVLGDFYDEVKDQDNLNEKVWDGIHSAQDLLFYTVR